MWKVRGCCILVLWRCSDPQCTHPSSGWGRLGLPSWTGPHVVLGSTTLSRKGTMSLKGSMIFAGQWLSPNRCIVPCLCAWGSPYWWGSVSDQSGLMSCIQIGNGLINTLNWICIINSLTFAEILQVCWSIQHFKNVILKMSLLYKTRK